MRFMIFCLLNKIKEIKISRNYNVCSCLFIIYVLAIPLKINAKWENPITGKVSNLTSSTNLFIDDAYFYSVIASTSGWNNKTIINRVALGIDKDDPNYYSAFYLNATVNILVLDENSSSSSYTKDLKITYNPANYVIENNLSIFEFESALSIDITFISIDAYDAVTNNPISIPKSVYLEAFIQVDRYQLLNPLSSPSLSPLSYLAGSFDEQTVTLSNLDGTENYDVEWLFLDKYSALPGTGSNSKFQYNFRHNASRLTVSNNQVQIPMIYPEGIILVRTRARGVTSYGSGTDWTWDEGAWSLPESGELYINMASSSKFIYLDASLTVQTFSAFYYDGYSLHLTWQRQASFAENGKQKQVVTYFDGLLRDRQSITKNNTEQLPIIGQRVYDFVGRPAIEILPVPDPDNSTLNYRPAFNKTTDILRAGKAYSYKDFDIDATALCAESITNRMDTSSGSSKYYSTNNTLSSTIVNKAQIPHAEGYPFIQTEYMPDNTGRIRRQGGVGIAHRLTGLDENANSILAHETKYYYHSPAQEELDRLFANEVGNAIHYKKQVVIDANGQQSVSYLDPQGRVIATALIGDPNSSPNMIPLDNVYTRAMNIDLARKNIVLKTDRSIIASHTFYVDDENTEYTFDYSFEAPQHTESCLPPEMCMHCIYKISLSIKNTNCDDEYIPLGDRERIVGEIDDICNETITFTLEGGPLVQSFPVGAYTITKKLTIDDGALEYYKNLFIENNQCIKTYQDFLEEERAKIDFENCHYTCEKCNADIEKIRIENSWTTSSPEFLEIKKGCDELCETKTPCWALHEMMLIDMSPGGQYFNNVNNATRTVDKDNEDNTFLSSDYDWLNTYINSTQQTTVFSSIATDYGITFSSWAELEANWNPEYAKYLIQFHPEYCYYTACLNINDSYLYDDDMLNTDEWLAAKTKGYYNPLDMNLSSFDLDYGSDYISNIDDPFFLMTVNASRKTSMEGKLTNYIIDAGYTDPENSAWKAMELATAQLGAKSCFNNYSWYAFRGMYLGLKQQYYKQYYESQCTAVVIPNNFTRRFILDDVQAKAAGGNDPAFDELTGSATDIENYMNTKIAEHCSTTCNEYAEHWMAKLAGCNLNTTDSANIRNHLVEICKKGCDAENPTGSRSIKPSETYPYKNFRQVLVDNGIFVLGICDDLLIEWPMNYGHDYWADLSPYSDTCACKTNKYTRDIKCKEIGPAKDTCLCGNDATEIGKKLIIGSNVAPEYKCKNCIDCYTINAELKSFFATYSYTLFFSDPSLFKNLVKNYLNIKFSMNLDYEDYVLFAAECLTEEAADSTSLYRLSKFDYYYIPGSYYIPSYTYNVLPFSSEFKWAKASDPELYNKRFIIDNSNKSTWLASLNYIPNNRYLSDYIEEKTLPIYNVQYYDEAPIYADGIEAIQTIGQECNCTELLRADALYKMGKIRASSSSMAYQVLHGYTFSDYDAKLKECCHYYKNTGQNPSTFPCTLSNSEADILLNTLRNGGSLSYPNSTIPPYSNMSIYEALEYFKEKPCPTDESDCHEQKVTLDQCGCESLLALKDKLKAQLTTLQYDALSEQDFRNYIERELGLAQNSLPSDFYPEQLMERCEDFHYTGAGDGNTGTPNSRGSMTNPFPPPPTIPDWKQTALDDLNETATDEELEIPRILSCHPYCDREIYTGGGSGGTYTSPEVFLPEPPKCKSPDCDLLIDLYKEFRDSVGIPSYFPLLPEEFQSEHTYRQFMMEYQQDAVNATYPFISSWFAYFPGLTTKQIFEKINASITTKLIADGYCHIESDRPYADPSETFNYFLMLMHCLEPKGFAQQECSICLESNDTLEKIQLWLNRLAANDLDILFRDNKNYKQPVSDPTKWVPQFYDNFYAGSIPNTIRQTIWTQKIPMLRYQIKDGLGGTNLIFDITLSFTDPMVAEKYNWRYVQSFSDIRFFLDEDCNPTDMFRVKAYFKLPPKYRKNNPNCPSDPNDPCYETIWLVGRVKTPANLINASAAEVPCPPCSTLCNRPYVPQLDTTDNCRKILDDIAERNAKYKYQQYKKAVLDSFEQRYIAKCLAPIETFTMSFTDHEYQQTLYYYDQADNLIKTVPPSAIKPLNPFSIDSSLAHRDDPVANPRVKPNHIASFITRYKYNTINQLIEQETPDGGVSHFWYDALGRLVLSQNAKQAATSKVDDRIPYSYTEYDELGRIYEVGQILIEDTYVNPENVADYDYTNNRPMIATLLIDNQNYKTEITRTIYDNTLMLAGTPPDGFNQQNTRNRVAHSLYADQWSNTLNTDYKYATHYNYDIIGNVSQVVQDFPELAELENQFKLIDYNYDLASGKVNMVSYQTTHTVGTDPLMDQFYHYYEYDADNRLTAAYTSRRPAVKEINTAFALPEIAPITGWTRDAKYFYYPHGPLSRYEIGEHKVQGVDYAYTIHGWLKSINSGIMDPLYDPGRDADMTLSSNPNVLIGRDAFSLELGYYTGDYIAIAPVSNISGKSGSDIGYDNVDLFNGNISHMVTSIPDITNWQSGTLTTDVSAQLYRYDQLNRLKSTRYYSNISTGTNEWDYAGTVPNDYRMDLSYDPNGNIMTLVREHGGGGGKFDELAYNYIGGTNKLEYVTDPVSASALAVDIDDQAPGNYDYDEIGNLIKDDAEEIETIEWNVYGKIKKITRYASSSKPDLEFEYNAAGQRIKKTVITKGGHDGPTVTWYVRDAGGNIMATYGHTDKEDNFWEQHFYVQEYSIYGSSRVGVLNDSLLLAYKQYDKEADVTLLIEVYHMQWYRETYGDESLDTFTLKYGYKKYELSNHLGNVHVTVTDRKLAVSASGVFVDYYNPDIVTITDYYAFGMALPDKQWIAGTGYRFGFNGMEKDNEAKGVGNSYDFGARIYDSRLGRWYSLDPCMAMYTSISPYSYALNNPTAFKDFEGMFVIDPKDPNADKLKQLVEAVRVSLATDSWLLEKFMLHSGLSAEQLDIIFTDGKGPELRTTTAEDGLESSGLAAFAYNYQNRLTYGIGEGKNNGTIIVPEYFWSNVNSFYQGVTLLHELVHLGEVIQNPEQLPHARTACWYSCKGIDITWKMRYDHFNSGYSKELKKLNYGQKTYEAGFIFEHDTYGRRPTPLRPATQKRYERHKRREQRREERERRKQNENMQHHDSYPEGHNPPNVG